MLLSENEINKHIESDKNFYTVERVFNDKQISLVKILDYRGRIYKAFFYDENERISNMSIYSINTGKEIKNITYKSDGKTISSVRIYNEENNKLSKVAFYKPDGKNVSSIVLYDEEGIESQCVMYCDDGEIIRFSI